MKKYTAYIVAAGLMAMLVLPSSSRAQFFDMFDMFSGEQVINDIRATANTGGNHAPAGSVIHTGNASASVSVINGNGGSATTSTSTISVFVEAATSTEPVIQKIIKEVRGAATDIRVEARAQAAATTATTIIHLDERGTRVPAEITGGVKGLISKIKSYISHVLSIFTR